MRYHPSSCIYVTFKHFLVGIVSGVECDIKEAVSKREIYARLLFCQQFYLLISTYYHLNRQNNILRLFHTRRRILSKRTTSTTPEKRDKIMSKQLQHDCAEIPFEFDPILLEHPFGSSRYQRNYRSPHHSPATLPILPIYQFHHNNMQFSACSASQILAVVVEGSNLLDQ
jgi:hypothetical protein